ncbi:hypothetical protein AB9M75_03870 [Lactobacillus sp. AN1001]
MRDLLIHIRNIEDKYGNEWYLNKDLNLSEDSDWNMILELREKYFGKSPIFDKSRYDYTGNPKKWTDECKAYIKEEVCDLLSSGVTEVTKINEFFGFSRGNKRWLKSVLNYFDLNSFYKECVENKNKIVLVGSGQVIYCKDMKEVAKRTGVPYKTVSWRIQNKKKVCSYTVYRYNEYVDNVA